MPLPNRVGYATTSTGTSSATLTLTPDGTCTTGMWMVAVVTNIVSPATAHTPPAGWTQIGSLITAGTTVSTVWQKKRGASETSYAWTQSASCLMTGAIMWFSGAADTGWVYGTQDLRTVTGTSFTNVATAITTTSPDNLILTLSFERTTAAESDISSITNASKWFFLAQNGSATNTITAGYSTKLTAGATSAVTITYPNTQANNGWAQQISIPGTNIVPVADFTATPSALTVNVNGSASSDADGTISSYAWNFGDGNTGTGSITSHTYAHGGRYNIQLTVTDNDGGTGSLTKSLVVGYYGPPLYVWDGTVEKEGFARNWDGTTEADAGSIELAKSDYRITDLMSTTPFYIGHRGSGQVWPEHTMEAYKGAVAAGAKAIEVSVWRTSDGTWVCQHDGSTLRMTGTDITIASNPYSAISGLTVNTSQSFLGPNSSAPPVTKFLDVLTELYGQVVFFIEVKAGSSTEVNAMIALMQTYPNYATRVVGKCHMGNLTAMGLWRTGGFKVWGYFDTTYTTTQLNNVNAAADYLGVPTYPYSGSAMSDADIQTVVALGKPVIGWEMWYKWQTTKYTALGIQGFMSSALPYNSRGPRRTYDNFASQKRMAGEWMYGNNPTWDGTGLTFSLTVSAYLMGSMHVPIAYAGGGYALDFEMQWQTVAGSSALHHGIAFGRADDDRWRFGDTQTLPGYNLNVARDGTIGLYTHTAGSTTTTQVGSNIASALISSPAMWVHMRIEVTATTIKFQRLDDGSSSQTVTDSQYRGQFIWLGSNNSTDRIRYRNIKLSLL